MRIKLYSSRSRSLEISLSDGKLTFEANDFGEACKLMNGSTSYDFFYALDEKNTARFIELLQEKYGEDFEVETALKNEFGSDDGSVKFAKFCDGNGIDKGFYCF